MRNYCLPFLLPLRLALVFMAAWVVANAAQPKPFRVAVAHFMHEATTFSSEKADVHDFPQPNLKGETLLNSRIDQVEGFVDAVREFGPVELIGLESPRQPNGGSSRGWITRAAYELYIGKMLADLKAALPVDGVYLALHGAAAVEGIDRPEAELARRIRALVGPDVPIAGTFDLHGNEDEQFLQSANFALACKYYPHYDMRGQGERAARLLVRAMRGEYKSTTATRKPRIISPTLMQWTGQSPWSNVIQRALVWEATQKDVFVSVFFGYPYADGPDLGATIKVMTNNDQALADRIADDMADFMWLNRHALLNTTTAIAPAEAVAKAVIATAAGETPVVLADYSDRPGDSTHILAEILKQDLSGVLYATMRDERTIAFLRSSGAKAGDAFDREVGGFVLTPDSGEPVRITGKVVYSGAPEGSAARYGHVGIIEFGRGNWLVVTGQRVQITSPMQMRFGPIDPSKFTAWVLKSRVHFRRGFDDTGYARKILIVDAPGPYLGTVHLDRLPYEKANLKDFYPFTDAPTWRP